jgi:hypothetical protein
LNLKLIFFPNVIYYSRACNVEWSLEMEWSGALPNIALVDDIPIYIPM